MKYLNYENKTCYSKKPLSRKETKKYTREYRQEAYKCPTCSKFHMTRRKKRYGK